jgi:hypothetical protein
VVISLGRLAIADPLLAAQQFLGIVKETFFWPALIGLPTIDNERHVIERATAMFLETYRFMHERNSPQKSAPHRKLNSLQEPAPRDR